MPFVSLMSHLIHLRLIHVPFMSSLIHDLCLTHVSLLPYVQLVSASCSLMPLVSNISHSCLMFHSCLIHSCHFHFLAPFPADNGGLGSFYRGAKLSLDSINSTSEWNGVKSAQNGAAGPAFAPEEMIKARGGVVHASTPHHLPHHQLASAQ